MVPEFKSHSGIGREKLSYLHNSDPAHFEKYWPKEKKKIVSNHVWVNSAKAFLI